MNKKRLLTIFAFCFFGAVIINGAAAIQPYKHTTYGDAMASFKSVGVYGIELRGLGFADPIYEWPNIPAPVTYGERIYPWAGHIIQTQCEYDAFFISVGFSIWSSDFDFFGMTMDELKLLWEGFEFEFYIDGIQQESIKNPIRPIRFIEWVIYGHPIIPDGYVDKALYIWNQGVVYKAGDLNVGIYDLTTKILLFGNQFYQWDIQFAIEECWH